jgi:hypothetical protein
MRRAGREQAERCILRHVFARLTGCGGVTWHRRPEPPRLLRISAVWWRPMERLAVRFAQAKAHDKPITGEAGILAGNGQSGCESLQQRGSDMSANTAAQFAAGDSAFLVWNWLLDPLGPCSYKHRADR